MRAATRLLSLAIVAVLAVGCANADDGTGVRTIDGGGAGSASASGSHPGSASGSASGTSHPGETTPEG